MAGLASLTAKACGVLRSMGFEPDQCVALSKQWALHQELNGLRSIKMEDAYRPVILNEPLLSGKLYIESRYDAYTYLYPALNYSSKSNILICPVGPVAPPSLSFAKIIIDLAGLDIRFVTVTHAEIRKIRDFLANGANALILVDSPQAPNHDSQICDIETPVGIFHGTTSLRKLCALLSDDLISVFCVKTKEGVRVEKITSRGHDAAIYELGLRIWKDPTRYELLPEMTKWWTLHRSIDTAIIFSSGDDIIIHRRKTSSNYKLRQSDQLRFLLDTRNDASGKIVAIHNYIERALKEKIDEIIIL